MGKNVKVYRGKFQMGNNFTYFERSETFFIAVKLGNELTLMSQQYSAVR